MILSSERQKGSRREGCDSPVFGISDETVANLCRGTEYHTVIILCELESSRCEKRTHLLTVVFPTVTVSATTGPEVVLPSP
jgi:hypothetical protein